MQYGMSSGRGHRPPEGPHVRPRSPDAFKVLPPLSPTIPGPPAAPAPYRLVPPGSRDKKTSFVIIAERSLKPTSNDKEVSGRVSPFRGRGFVPPSNWRNASSDDEGKETLPRPLQKRKSTGSLIPQPTRKIYAKKIIPYQIVQDAKPNVSNKRLAPRANLPQASSRVKNSSLESPTRKQQKTNGSVAQSDRSVGNVTNNDRKLVTTQNEKKSTSTTPRTIHRRPEQNKEGNKNVILSPSKIPRARKVGVSVVTATNNRGKISAQLKEPQHPTTKSKVVKKEPKTAKRESSDGKENSPETEELTRVEPPIETSVLSQPVQEPSTSLKGANVSTIVIGKPPLPPKDRSNVTNTNDDVENEKVEKPPEQKTETNIPISKPADAAVLKPMDSCVYVTPTMASAPSTTLTATTSVAESPSSTSTTVSRSVTRVGSDPDQQEMEVAAASTLVSSTTTPSLQIATPNLASVIHSSSSVASLEEGASTRNSKDSNTENMASNRTESENSQKFSTFTKELNNNNNNNRKSSILRDSGSSVNTDKSETVIIKELKILEPKEVSSESVNIVSSTDSSGKISSSNHSQVSIIHKNAGDEQPLIAQKTVDGVASLSLSSLKSAETIVAVGENSTESLLKSGQELDSPVTNHSGLHSASSEEKEDHGRAYRALRSMINRLKCADNRIPPPACCGGGGKSECCKGISERSKPKLGCFQQCFSCCGKMKCSGKQWNCCKRPECCKKPSCLGRGDGGDKKQPSAAAPKRGGRCCGETNCRGCLKRGCRTLFCLDQCTREKCCSCCRKKKDDHGSRRSNPTLSKKQSQTSSQAPPPENIQKLDPALVEHISLIKGAIPVLPIPLAWMCLIFNIFVPGLGTLSSGLFCLCFGKPRFSVRDEPHARVGACCLDIIIGIGQMFTIVFCLVGWGWSIWWGIIMVKLARKQKKIKLAERQQEEAAAAAAVTAAAMNHDVERA